jgi:hypothetical protein
MGFDISHFCEQIGFRPSLDLSFCRVLLRLPLWLIQTYSALSARKSAPLRPRFLPDAGHLDSLFSMGATWLKRTSDDNKGQSWTWPQILNLNLPLFLTNNLPSNIEFC